MNIHEDCCTNAFWKKTVWTLLWRNQSLSFWPVFETSWQLQGLGKEIMNKQAQLEHTQFRKFLDRNSNFVAPALIPFHKAERLQKFEPNPRQRTNLPLGWMFDNLDLLDSITSSCRQNSIVCTAAHTSSRVTSKFLSVESMHIAQCLIGSRSHQHPSAGLYNIEKQHYFWMSGPMANIVLAVSIIHRKCCKLKLHKTLFFPESDCEGFFLGKTVSCKTG